MKRHFRKFLEAERNKHTKKNRQIQLLIIPYIILHTFIGSKMSKNIID